MRKPVRRSKIMWASLLVAILGVLFDNLTYVQNIIDERWYGIILITIGVIMAILRYYTTDQD
jgi:uncharacterized membrane protein